MKREDIAQYSYRYAGNWKAIEQAILKEEENPCYKVYEPYITYLDPEYPEEFRQLDYPPWVLFYRGNIHLLKKRKITIIGSREISARGKYYTRQVCAKLRKDFVLISGLAKGVDALVHESCLQDGQTIAIIGSGLETHYPVCNEKLYQELSQNHLILSEWPGYVRVQKFHFPWRNRLLAALGEKIIVTQAKYKSGTMITVQEALQLGKDVYCLPYPLNEVEGSGCNQLIQEGASLYIEDVFE
ncbi:MULTISPECIES: DNA-processing protein DprA [Terrabacteria group]|uniref:DNA-processing protein DprA n=1 Tax=Bacillati TaxID=1783272 RepID=UPI001C6E50E6|nr:MULTISPECIES: DNA-processing protein DprA [Terrabacteria group]MBW9212055.1 DNA-processing protein DprA [Trueperella sp. zg.1013]